MKRFHVYILINMEYTKELQCHEKMLSLIRKSVNSELSFMAHYESYESKGYNHCPLVTQYYDMLKKKKESSHDNKHKRYIPISDSAYEMLVMTQEKKKKPSNLKISSTSVPYPTNKKKETKCELIL